MNHHIRMYRFLCAILVCFSVSFLSGCGKGTSAPKAAERGEGEKTAADMIAEAKQEYITKGQIIAAVDAASLAEAMQNMANPAKLKEMSDNRKIVMLRKGLPVVIEKRFNNGIVNVKPQGFDVTLWTIGSGLEEKN